MIIIDGKKIKISIKKLEPAIYYNPDDEVAIPVIVMSFYHKSKDLSKILHAMEAPIEIEIDNYKLKGYIITIPPLSTPLHTEITIAKKETYETLRIPNKRGRSTVTSSIWFINKSPSRRR